MSGERLGHDELDYLTELLARYDLPAKEPYLIEADLVNSLPDLIAAARPPAGEAALRERLEIVIAEHASPDGDYARHGGDALLSDIRAALATPVPADDRP